MGIANLIPETLSEHVPAAVVKAVARREQYFKIYK